MDVVTRHSRGSIIRAVLSEKESQGNIYNDERSHIDVEDGEGLAEFAKRTLIDRLFNEGGETRHLVPAAMTDSVADILGLDHGSVLMAAIEEAQCSDETEERFYFFEGLGSWFYDADHESLAETFIRSADALRVMQDQNRKKDVAATWRQRRAIAALGDAAL